MRQSIKLRVALAAFVAASLFTTCANAASPNLVTNPNFDATVSGWIVLSPANDTFIWTNQYNTVGATGSGSAFSQSSKINNWNVNSTCISRVFPKNAEMTFGGSVAIPASQAGTGSAAVGVVYFTSTNCADGTTIIGDILHADDSAAQWTAYSKVTVLPSSANSAHVYLNIDLTENGMAFGALFDGLKLQQDIFIDGFDGT